MSSRASAPKDSKRRKIILAERSYPLHFLVEAPQLWRLYWPSPNLSRRERDFLWGGWARWGEWVKWAEWEPSPNLSQRERDKFVVLPGGRGTDFKKGNYPSPLRERMGEGDRERGWVRGHIIGDRDACGHGRVGEVFCIAPGQLQLMTNICFPPPAM